MREEKKSIKNIDKKKLESTKLARQTYETKANHKK